MANPLFTWNPDEGSLQSTNAVVRVSKFGDGYEQRINDGLNHMPEIWQVEFSGNTEEINAIRGFLKSRGGSEKFDWVTPYSETLSFVCQDWEVARPKTSLHTLKASFRQVFEP